MIAGVNAIICRALKFMIGPILYQPFLHLSRVPTIYEHITLDGSYKVKLLLKHFTPSSTLIPMTAIVNSKIFCNVTLSLSTYIFSEVKFEKQLYLSEWIHLYIMFCNFSFDGLNFLLYIWCFIRNCSFIYNVSS